jgi:transposase-like protein
MTETSRHREAFEAWIKAGRRFPKISKRFGVTERTLRNWAKWFRWRQRADLRDREAAIEADRRAIRAKARQIQAARQAEAERLAAAQRQAEAEEKAARPAPPREPLPLPVTVGRAKRPQWVGGNHNAHATRQWGQAVLGMAKEARRGMRGY